MVALIFGILFLVGGIVAYVELKYKNRKLATLMPVIGAVLCVVIIISGCMATVSTGNTGIVTTFGRVEPYTLDSGIHFVAPWQTVLEMDNRVQKSVIDMMCFSSDIQEVACVYTINYQINKANAQNIYKTIGQNYYDTVITPAVTESVKTVMAHYTAENLISNRDSLADEIEILLSAELDKFNIELVSTSIEDMDFTDEFTNAVEAKQVAVQNKLRATTEQEQKTMEAEQAAERAKIEADAEAAVAKIKAEADAEVAQIAARADLEVQKVNADAAEYTGQKEAAKNKAIQESLSEELLRYMLIQQWDGSYPETYLGSDNVSMILDIQ